MKNTIVICTNNLVPPALFRKVLMNAFIQADMLGDTCVSVVSHYPVFEDYTEVEKISFNIKLEKKEHKNFSDVLIKHPIFNPSIFNSGYSNVVFGECEYNNLTIYKQLLAGAERNKKGNVIIMEHDVLYPITYLKSVSGALEGSDACYWANGAFFSSEGFYKIFNVMTLSRFGLRYNKFLDVYYNKLQNKIGLVEPFFKGLSVEKEMKSDKEVVIDSFAMIHGIDTLDIRHGLNASGNYLVDNYSNSHEYWGSSEEILPLISGSYKDFVIKHPSYNYGVGD